MRDFRTLYFRRSGSLGQSQQDNGRAQRLYRTYPRKYLQINDIKGDLNIYFGGFSSQFMEHNLQSHSFFWIRCTSHWGVRYQSKAGRRQNDGGVHAAAYQDVNSFRRKSDRKLRPICMPTYIKGIHPSIGTRPTKYIRCQKVN